MRSDIKENFLIWKKNRKIACASLTPSVVNFQVVAIHGFSEHMRNYYAAAERLAEQGAAVHLMDLPGHGLSSGARGDIGDFPEYIEAVDFFVNSSPGFLKNAPTFLFGHSMGGLIAFHYCLKKRPDVKGLILSSPLAGFSTASSWSLKLLARLLSIRNPGRLFPKRVTPWELVRNPDKWSFYHEDPYYLRVCSPRLYLAMNSYAASLHEKAADFALPLLIFSSVSDKVVSYSKIKSFWLKAGSEDKTIAVFSQARHHLINEEESELVVGKMLCWMKERT